MMEQASIHELNSSGPGYVVVEGSIGVGKTSLARRLADRFGCDLLLEQPAENPFLERFYQSREHYALPTQLYFLFQRARQLRDLRQGDLFRSGRIADFMLEKDPLFARLTLDEDELRLYEQVYAQLRPEVSAPDLVVYLQAPVEVVMDRIRRRGIDYELAIDRDYLQRISEAYTQYFYSYTRSPLLIINAAEINFVDSDDDFAVLVEQIGKIRSGRHFFNPLASSRA